MTRAELPPNRLEELRDLHGLHRVEVAAVCKVSERTYRRWENNEVAIPDPAKLKLAAFFEVSVEHLMAWDQLEQEAAAA